MAFEIKSSEIVSIERHPRLREHVSAIVRIGVVEHVGAHMLDIKVRVVADENAPDEVIQQSVLAKALRVIKRTIAAIDQHDLPMAAE